MSNNEKYAYLCSAEDSHLNKWRDECDFISFSAGVQTPAEPDKSLWRMPRIFKGSFSSKLEKNGRIKLRRD